MLLFLFCFGAWQAGSALDEIRERLDALEKKSGTAVQVLERR